MTREFNKQERNDRNRSFRDTPPRRYQAEDNARPTRSRPNRASVDRAWQDGATNTHPDYHPRTRANDGRPPQRPWQQGQRQGHSPNGSSSYRSDGYRQDNYRPSEQRFERPFNREQGPRSRYSDADNRRPQEHRSYRQGNNYDRNASGPSRFHNSRDNEDRAPFRGQNFGNSDRFRQEQRTPHFSRRRDFEEEGTRNTYSPRPPFRREQENGAAPYSRQPDSYDRQRPSGDRGGFRPYNRQQSFERPNGPKPYDRQRSYENERGTGNGRFPKERERFEGDYEHYNDTATPRSFREKPYSNNRRRSDDNKPERHVTPLPDGRVIKGPRPVQRKNAQFWTEVAHDTESLVEQLHSNPQMQPREVEQDTATAQVSAHISEAPEQENSLQPDAESAEVVKRPKVSRPKVLPKPGPRTASAVRRKKGEKAKTVNLNDGVPRPSQRGFKWPNS